MRNWLNKLYIIFCIRGKLLTNTFFISISKSIPFPHSAGVIRQKALATNLHIMQSCWKGTCHINATLICQPECVAIQLSRVSQGGSREREREKERKVGRVRVNGEQQDTLEATRGTVKHFQSIVQKQAKVLKSFSSRAVVRLNSHCWRCHT